MNFHLHDIEKETKKSHNLIKIMYVMFVIMFLYYVRNIYVQCYYCNYAQYYY
jgi:hypothetical protein